MIPDIGLMVGAYIVTRMIRLSRCRLNRRILWRRFSRSLL